MNTYELKVKQVWDRIAKEDLTIEKVHGCVYAFGSELACRRLHDSFKGFSRVAEYSLNLKTWFFRLDPKSVVFE